MIYNFYSWLPIIALLLAGGSCENGSHSPPPDANLQCSSPTTEAMWGQFEAGSGLLKAQATQVRVTASADIYPVGTEWGLKWLVEVNFLKETGVHREDGELLDFCRGFAKAATDLVLSMAALTLPPDPDPRPLLSDLFPLAPDPDKDETEKGYDKEHLVTPDGRETYRIVVERKTPTSPGATVRVDHRLIYGTATTPAGTFQALARLTVTDATGAAATATNRTLIGISVSLPEATAGKMPRRLYLVHPQRAAQNAGQMFYDQVAEGSYAGDTTTVRNGVYRWYVRIQPGESIFLATAVTRNTYRLIPNIPAVEPVTGRASTPLRLVRFGIRDDKVVQMTDCGNFDPDRPYRILHRGSESLPQPPGGDLFCTDLTSSKGLLTGLSLALSANRPVSFARYWLNADIGSYINYAYLGAPPPSQPCVIDPPIVDMGTDTCPLPIPVYRPRAPVPIYPRASVMLPVMTEVNCLLPCDSSQVLVDYDERIPDEAVRSWSYWYALDYRPRAFHWMNCAYHHAVKVAWKEYSPFEFGQVSPSFYQMFSGCVVGWSAVDGEL